MTRIVIRYATDRESETCQPVTPDLKCGIHPPWSAGIVRLQCEHTLRDWRASRLRGTCIVVPPLDIVCRATSEAAQP